MKASLSLSRRRFTSLLAVASATRADAPNHLPAQKVEAFLSGATLVSAESLKIGIARTRRLKLSDGALTHDAHFQTIDSSRSNFRDTYKFNIAAYRLDRLLELNMTPPSIERSIEGVKGALTWWIPGGLMEFDRLKRKIEPPDPEYFNSQMHALRVFDLLIFNIDRNLQNLLLTADGKVWMIDHTRAFRRNDDLRNKRDIVRCDRRLFAALQKLDQPALKTAMGEFLDMEETASLLKRRDKIVATFQARAAEAGDLKVFDDLPLRAAEYPVEPPGKPWPE